MLDLKILAELMFKIPHIFPSDFFLSRLWRHISMRRRIQGGLLVGLMLLSSLTEIMSIGAVLPFLGVLTSPERVFQSSLAQPFIRNFGISSADQLLLPLTIIFCTAIVFSGVARLLILWANIRFSSAIGTDLSISIYRRTLYQPYSTHVARNSSDVIAGITGKANNVVGSTVLPCLTLLSSAVMLIGIMFVLLTIDIYTAIASFGGFAFIYLILVFFTKKRLAEEGLRISSESSKVLKALQEGLGGIRDVLIDGTQDIYCKIYRNADVPLRKAQANITILSICPRYGIEALGMVLIALLAFILANRNEGISGAIPVLGALALGAQRILPMLQQTYQSWCALRGGHSSLQDALDLLDQPLPEFVDLPPSPPIRFEKSIKLCGISFRYDPDTPWILNDLTLQIPKGHRIGFIGATGCGKSTLIDILMGLLQPNQGAVEIDGCPINLSNQRAWYAHLAHVPQAVFLSDISIEENIALGTPQDQIDHERVRYAAQSAQIASTIELLPKKYKTPVGERGIRLSGGQRQRIGIARALYKKADVIVLDEATSALDSETEKAVMDAIDNLDSKVTVIIIAHRLSTLKRCNAIVELSNGQIRRICDYSQLVESAE
jgi:ABC-type bacteriocin/lantibiotic exporter with double-glycine peptidase domain